MSVKNEILLKPFSQTSGFCGPACVKMILNYFKVGDCEEREIADLALATRERGTSLRGFIKVANYFYLQLTVKNNSKISDLSYCISKKVPAIVDWFLEDDGHYSLVTGLDLDEEKIVIIDPADDHHRREVSITWFTKVWFDYYGNYPYRRKNFILRRMIVLTPFEESFQMRGGRVLTRPPRLKI